jgi:hypothetical protein
MPRKITKADKPQVATPDTHHVRWSLTGIAVGMSWTLIACGVAFLQGDDVWAFLHEWMNLQGPFLIALGTWLLLIVRSGSFFERASQLTADDSANLGVFKKRKVRYILVGSITVLGFVSGVRMGFNEHGIVLAFLWITLACYNFVSALVMLHSLELIAVMNNLQKQKLKISRFAPARTPELISIVAYFSSFTLLMTVGYAFNLLGNFKGNWTGSKDYVQAVRLSWPFIDVPICCVVLIYPHIVAHKLIRREKEQMLSSFQQDIDKLLSKYDDLKTEEIERANKLTQLFDRIKATPNYVIDVGIAAKTALPLMFNIATLFIKYYMGQNQP